MKWLGLLAALLVASLVPDGALAQSGRSPREILDRADDLFRGRSSHGRLTLKVVTAHYSRELTLEAWNKGKDLALVRILAPQKEKGIGTLRSGHDVWNYLPNTQRVVKVPGSMMGGSWMGSHFTHDDLVKQSRMADDFTYAETFRGTRDGQAVTELTLTPRPDSAVVWGKVVLVVRDSDLIPLRTLYYDEDLRLARTLTFSDVRDLGGRKVPTLLRIVPEDRPTESTEVRYHQLEFDVKLDDAFFSLQSLQR